MSGVGLHKRAASSCVAVGGQVIHTIRLHPLSPPPLPPHPTLRVVKESLTPLNFTIVLPTVVDLLERAVPSDPNAGGGGGGGGRRGEQRVGHPQLLPELMGLLLSGGGGAGGRAARGALWDPLGE